MTFDCIDCKATKPVQRDGGTGYAECTDGKICYECCAERDKAEMRRTGRTVMYWHNSVVSNWPGTLKFQPAFVRTGKHNMCGTVTTAYFQFEGAQWSGRHMGRNNEIMRCRRLAK